MICVILINLKYMACLRSSGDDGQKIIYSTFTQQERTKFRGETVDQRDNRSFEVVILPRERIMSEEMLRYQLREKVDKTSGSEDIPTTPKWGMQASDLGCRSFNCLNRQPRSAVPTLTLTRQQGTSRSRPNLTNP